MSNKDVKLITNYSLQCEPYQQIHLKLTKAHFAELAEKWKFKDSWFSKDEIAGFVVENAIQEYMGLPVSFPHLIVDDRGNFRSGGGDNGIDISFNQQTFNVKSKLVVPDKFYYTHYWNIHDRDYYELDYSQHYYIICMYVVERETIEIRSIVPYNEALNLSSFYNKGEIIKEYSHSRPVAADTDTRILNGDALLKYNTSNVGKFMMQLFYDQMITRE